MTPLCKTDIPAYAACGGNPPGTLCAGLNETSVQEAEADLRHAAGPMGRAACATVSVCNAQQTNDASLSPLLTGLFPPGVVGAELQSASETPLSFRDETHHHGSPAQRRIQEFSAGRLCAARAMAEFGFSRHPLHMNPDRRPQWPSSVIGSISHTSGMCGAVVARKNRYHAIGLDMEIVGHVTPEVWPYICTRQETAWLNTQREPARSRCAALIFSAKEAFYKCQYGITQQWIEFDDVMLEPRSMDASVGRFTLRPRRRIKLQQYVALPLIGRFAFKGSLVVTGMALSAF